VNRFLLKRSGARCGKKRGFKKFVPRDKHSNRACAFSWSVPDIRCEEGGQKSEIQNKDKQTVLYRDGIQAY
jgi:hypothetical protein